MLPEASNTSIQGLRKIQLDIREDERGWFEETWQSEKFSEIGLGFFKPLQANASHNLSPGVTRGFHAEPWSKLVTVTNGSVFAAWVDLRDGPNFGATHWDTIKPGISYFVPKGVANSYQALEAGTSYTYLVDGIWKPGVRYPSVHVFDPDLSIPWPIQQSEASLSPKDDQNPGFALVRDSRQADWVVFGSGQVAKAICAKRPGAKQFSRQELNFGEASFESLLALIPSNSVVVNAGAFTNVDACETAEGFDEAMKVNYQFPSLLAKVCTERSATLVHFSSDYVFDGKSSSPYREEDSTNPKSRYGVTKLLGDMAVSSCPHSYIVRTSWVFGDGKNFFNTILRLAREGRQLEVVDDQWGRPTSAMEIARFVDHLVTFGHDFGLYNFTLEGDAVTWHALAASVLQATGLDASLLNSISSKEYGEGKSLAPRPSYSVLDLQKMKSTGFLPEKWPEALRHFIESQT